MARVRAGLLVAAAALTLSACGAQAPAAPAAPAAPPQAPAVATTGGDVDHPVIGVAYPFELFTHCGIDRVQFAGRDWKAVQPRPAPADLPHANGIGENDGYTEGTMTLLALDRAQFDVTDPHTAPLPGGVEFVPAAPQGALCG